MDYNYILQMISLILAILILLSILYGCKYTNYNIENFESKSEDKKKDAKKDSKKEQKFKLSPIEESFIDGIKNGDLDIFKISDLIKNGKLDKGNLENMINYIESNKIV